MSNQKPNLGSPNFSRRIPNCNDKNKKCNNATISKYFTRKSKEKKTSTSSEKSVESSPTYSTNLTDIKKIEFNDENDFKTPKPIKVNKGTSVKAGNAKLPPRRKAKRSNLQQALAQKINYSDSNDEHMHLAIALSESEQSQPSNEDTSQPYLSTQQIKENTRQTLEQYGFRTNRPGKTDRKQIERDVVKKKKKSRYYHIPATLLIRTQEEREQLITKEITDILNKNFDYSLGEQFNGYNSTLDSFLLKKMHCKESTIFSINNLTLEELNAPNRFCKTTLNIQQFQYNCGYLLKKWENIPGREVTPPREINTSIVDNNISSQFKDESDLCKKDDSLTLNNSEIGKNKNPDHTAIKENMNSDDTIISDNNHLHTEHDDIRNRSFSPDLFSDSDDAAFNDDHNMCVETTKSGSGLSFSNLSQNSSGNTDYPIEVNNGICHFESFCEDEAVLSQKCMSDSNTIDLTLSSDSDDENKSDYKHPYNVELVSSGIEDAQEEKFNKNLSIKNTSFDENVSLHDVTAYVNDILCNYDDTNDTKSDIPKTDENENLSDEEVSEPLSLTASTDSSLDVILISDEELNYSSIHFSPNKLENIADRKCISPNSDTEIVIELPTTFNKSFKVNEKEEKEDEIIENNTSPNNPKCMKATINYSSIETPPKILHPRVRALSNRKCAPQKTSKELSFFDDTLGKIMEQSGVISSLEMAINNTTPQKCTSTTEATLTPQGTMLVKTSDITPIGNYDAMSTPEINDELARYGLKKLKRKHGVHLLKYLYESTHPALEGIGEKMASDEECGSLRKRRRKLIGHDDNCINQNSSQISGEENNLGKVDIVDNGVNNELLEEEMIFERKQSKKIKSCRLPLHIAWYNLVSANTKLKESILLYEPVQIEVLYSMLKDHITYRILYRFLIKSALHLELNQMLDETMYYFCKFI